MLHLLNVTCGLPKLSGLNAQLTVVPSDLWPVQCTLTLGTGRWSCSPAEARTSSATVQLFKLQVEQSEGGQSSGAGCDEQIGCECLTSCWGIFARQPFCGPAHWCLITLWSYFWLQFRKRNLLLEVRGLRNDFMTLTLCISAERHRPLNPLQLSDLLDVLCSCHSFKQISRI